MTGSGTTYIAQGEDAVADSETMIISTILGSCVSVCLWDPAARVGGMNHLLLPELKEAGNPMNTTGAVAMERLINRMVRLGAERTLLRAKLFGGSSMLSGMTDIGERNIAFARRYLSVEGIPCDAESVGGDRARRIRFWPASGAVRQKLVDQAPELVPAPVVMANEVELF